MSDLYVYKNYTNNATIPNDLNLRQPKTFQTPLFGLLLAATILAKASQAKPFLLGYGQSPWIPLKPYQNYLPSVSPLWQPLPGNIYSQYNQLTTSSPQIQPPPLNQQQIIHIHETPSVKNPPDDNIEAIQEHGHQQINTNHKIGDLEESQIPTFEESNLRVVEHPLDLLSTTEEGFQDVESDEIDNDIDPDYDNKADSSNISYTILNSTDFPNVTENSESSMTEVVFSKSNENSTASPEAESTEIETKIRSRRTTPKPIRRTGSRRPVSDYIESRIGDRRRPTRRRTTTSSYDYGIFEKQGNRRRKRPSTSTKGRPNRRPINREPEFYDNDYDDDEYDDFYPNNVNILARQDDTSTTETTTTTDTTTTGTTMTTKSTSVTQDNNTYGYTYGPPVQTGYGPPGQTGYGPSNGNEYVSITYPPISGPGRDALAPLLDSLYNPYSKNSIIRRLQELLQPNNFYNNQQYDVNYPENF